MSESDDSGDQQQLIAMIQDSKVAMLTYREADGALIAKPMATQKVAFDGTILFIAQRSSEKVQAIEADPHVNVSYSEKGAWVSLSGTARVVEDGERLRELWSTFTDAWLDGGPEDPDNILLEIDADSAEYWGGPGNSTLMSLANLVKHKATGERLDGTHGTVQL